MKRILVTGAGKNGFLGYHVKEAFKPYKAFGTNQDEIEKCHMIYVGSEYDLTSKEETDHMFLNFVPNIVVHMAAACGGILANKNSPADFLRDNTLMGINIYEAARKFDCNRVYTLGSVCSYAEHCPTPFKEDDLFNGYPEPTNAAYGQAKRTLLMLGQTYREQYGIGGAHLIPANLFGIMDHFDLVNSHVIPALINKFTNADKEDVVKCWGSGSCYREFLFAPDCAEAIVMAVISDLDTPLPINIGTGKDISIKDLAYLIASLTNFKGKIEFTGEVSDGQPKRRLNVSRAKELLGFEAETDLETGLRKTIEWYLSR